MNLPRASRARRLRLRTTSIAVGVALAAGPVPFLAAAPASAAAAKHYDDFNGDGYRDLAVSHTHDGIFAFNDRAVLVTYGGPKGLTTKKQVIHQNSPGIPGASESGDEFGTVLASADLNRDGYADLVVGNPSEAAGRTRVGSVTLVWGSAKGLKGGTALPRKATNGYGTFGADIATGDFNGDGRPDIAAVNGGDVFLYRGGFTKSGGLGKVSKYDREGQSWDSDTIAAGKVNGDGKTDLIVMGVRGIGMTFRTEAWFLKGSTGGLVSGPAKVVDGKKQHERLDAAVGDFDRDGFGDIAVGNPVANDGRGVVIVWYGTSAGPGKRSVTLSQSTAGVAGASEAWDQFGSSLTAGDADGDGYADLAVGVPGEKVGAKANAGGAYLFRGGKGGLAGSRSAALGKSLPGVAGETTDHDLLGYDLRLRDLNRDGRADLAVSVAGDGTVRILPGAKGGVTGAGSSVLRDIGANLPE
ncbi:hypothetical protein GTX53_15705 [Streptomyces sp. SID5594]|uniref:FG-GAP and VCBS repeat-containing protein n=1 Tax=unclassified Streptomyces TaxID=2593676 RepID=UPI000361C4DB|nr:MULTISPECIES: FG-GAP and VCBS repeat-containing protein [unclassified Streptomyces]MZF55264.1 hypothetical protein [Streptomyces sp. SID5594]